MDFFKDLKKHRVPAIAELLHTEEKYVNVLEMVVNGYIKEFKNKNSDTPPPEGLKEYSGFVIFANIAEIHQFHKNYFLKALHENHHSTRDLSQIFIQNEDHFHMYSKFSLDKPMSEHLISTHFNYFEKIRKKLGHKNTIVDLMIAPVQRITRYPLMLESFLKHLKKQGLPEDVEYITDALNILKKVGKKVNEFRVLSGLRNFDGLISDQGNLILHGPLMCDYNGKRSKLYVYLFKFSILLTEKQEPKRKSLSVTYNFRLRIPLNQLHLKELPNNKFSLQLTEQNAPNCNVICQAESKDENKKWTHAIRQLLTTQIDVIHGLVHPTTNDEREILL